MATITETDELETRYALDNDDIDGMLGNGKPYGLAGEDCIIALLLLMSDRFSSQWT